MSVIPSPPASRGWSLLRDGVPITLLCDLLYVDGPPSREILTTEALADDVRLAHPHRIATAHPAGGSGEPPEVAIVAG
jgi:hypothetical protein